MSNWELAHQLADQAYDVEIRQDVLLDGTPIFIAMNPELSGCMAQGETIAEALKSLDSARQDFIYFKLADDRTVPPPNPPYTNLPLGVIRINGYAPSNTPETTSTSANLLWSGSARVRGFDV